MLKQHRSIGYTVTSVGTALHFYMGANAKDVQTLRTVIKKLYPETEAMGVSEFQAFLNGLALEELARKLDGSGWAEVVKVALLARYPADETHLKRYPRFLKRFLDFAATAGMLEPLESALLPGWEELIGRAQGLLPANKSALAALVAAGAITLLGRYPINAEDLDATAKKVNDMRSALRRLARNASSADLTPREYAEEVLTGTRQDEIGVFATQRVYASYCRHLWNATIAAYPELDLPAWPDRRRQIGIKMVEWVASLRTGVMAAVFERPGMSPLSPKTVKGYRDKLQSMVGILERAGFELEVLLTDLAPRDAVRLMFAGWPRELLTGDTEQDAPLAIYRRLVREPAYKHEVLGLIRAEEGISHGRKLEENPFVTVILQERYAEEKYPSAESMLDRVSTINAEYLAMGEGNRKWISARLAQVSALAENTETEYDEKKQLIFKHPRLFEHLLEREKAIFDGLAERFSGKGSHWATHVRDLTYLVLVTLYPLRVTNHQLMKLGENYDVADHGLRFKKNEVKNKKSIDFELPGSGRLGWVRTLVDLYLDEARPLLLRGAKSDYFFVGNHQAPNAQGFLQRQLFNEILINLGAKFLEGVLPAELGHPNPHLFRHIAATYQIVIRKDPNMAARLLNDTIETIYKHYADILASSRTTCKEFYDGFEPAS